MSDSVLPGGLTIDTLTTPIRVEICRADPDGPAFVCFLKRMSPEKFRKLGNRTRTPDNVRPGSKAEDIHRRKFAEAFCKDVFEDEGWEGLTLPNLNYLLPVDKRARLPEGAPADSTFDFTIEFAGRLYDMCWNERFADVLFDAAKNGVDEGEEAEEEKNDY